VNIEHPLSSPPLWLGLALGIVVIGVVVLPAAWIILIQVNRRQTGSGVIALVLFGFAALLCFASLAFFLDPIGMGAQAQESNLFATGAGVLALLGTFFLVYARQIYSLSLPSGPAVQKAPSETPGEPPEGTKAAAELGNKWLDLRNRLLLFLTSLAIAYLLVLLIALVKPLQDQPQYVFYTFFGVLLLGMVSSGLISEDMLKWLMPWASSRSDGRKEGQ
jgi:hypothetical protein